MIALCGQMRRKEPEKVRQALIDAAACLITDKGMARLTVDAVAKAAGVTKGGLFHHFASKDDLVRGVQDAMIAFAEESINAEIAADPIAHGRYTRAYLNGVLRENRLNDQTPVRTLCLAMLADPALQTRWGDWVGSQVQRHAETDDNPSCAMVRLTGDGIWLNSLRNLNAPPTLSVELYNRLIDLTHPTP